VYKPGSTQADSVEYFEEFDGLLQHVRLFKQMNAGVDKLRIHAPARATDEERMKLRNYGTLAWPE
jgi:hypothetical protein